MATGTISWVNASKGHAFVTPDAGGPDRFVKPSRDGAQMLFFAGASVEFDLRHGAKGRIAATNVALRKPPAADPGRISLARVGDGARASAGEARSW
jgi:cold shock CspA family protein